MHFHSPEDSASAIQYVLRPDSWSARPEGGYQAFPEAVCQVTLWFFAHRLIL